MDTQIITLDFIMSKSCCPIGCFLDVPGREKIHINARTSRRAYNNHGTLVNLYICIRYNQRISQDTIFMQRKPSTTVGNFAEVRPHEMLRRALRVRQEKNWHVYPS
jgi:hypothetical protein